MAEELHWHTVTTPLRSLLELLMGSWLFDSFRLVGGTSLSLQLGHRMSADIDLFTDAAYGTLDFNAIDKFLRHTYPYASTPIADVVGMGRSYLVGENEHDTIKLDLYYTDPFIRPCLQLGPYRLASVDEIIAMKIDIVQRKARKKDFWDLHAVKELYSFDNMVALHAERYPYNHNAGLIKTNFIDFTQADEDFDPICLKGNIWEFIKLDLIEFVA